MSGELIQFSAEDKQEAAQLREKLDEQLSALRVHQSALSTGFVEVGKTLLTIREKRYWIQWGFQNWTEFLEAQATKGLQRAQLFRYVKAVEELEPYMTHGEMTEIGIEKASELRNLLAVKGSVSGDMVEDAKTMTKQELQEAIGRATNEPPPEGTKFWNLGGIFTTDNERAVIQESFRLAEGQGDPIQPSAGPATKLKELLLRMSMECISSWAPKEGQE